MKEASIVEIERKAIALIDRFRKEAGLSEAKLGELAFPEVKNYRQKIKAYETQGEAVMNLCAFG